MVEETAYEVGRAACIVLDGVVDQCPNGGTLEIGYLVATLILIIAGFAVFLRPAN